MGPWRPYECAKGHCLFLQGSSAAEIILIKSGLVKLTCALESGDEVLLAVRFPGEPVELCAPITQVPHLFSATALTHCDLLRAEALRLQGVVQFGGAPAVSLVHKIVAQLYSALLEIVDLKALTAEERLRRLLLRLQCSLELEGRRPAPSIRHADLAALLGVSPEHFSRLRKKLGGVVMSRHPGGDVATAA